MDPGAREAWEDARPGRALGHRPACVAPWVALEIDPSGWVYACCANQLYPLGRIGEQRLRDLWGGPRAQVLREALARWDLTVGCGSCQWHLEHGRMDPDAAVYDRYPVAGEDPSGPVAMTFALSNRCNLGCVMCTPELSSTLRHQAGLAPIASPWDDHFYQDLASFLPGLQYAKFLGGEPFLIPEHHRVWDLMDQVGGPPRMQVTTNGTIWNDKVAWLLERFRFDVTVSVDATTPEAYESIRVGARWDAVRANVERFRAACERAGTELRLCFCLMDRNAGELAPMVRWAAELGASLSINVVSDAGLALHDLSLDRLLEVRAAWSSDSERGGFGALAEVWHAQVAQLDAVIEERREGRPPPARQPLPAGPGTLAVPPAPEGTEAGGSEGSEGSDGAVELDEERERLRRWSGGGAVAEIRGDVAGTITDVVTGHDRLGIGPELVGRDLDGLLVALSAADGRRAWELGVDLDRHGRSVRTVIFSGQAPVRGAQGSVVRFVARRAGRGFVLLVAEDRTYDRVPVAVAPPQVRR